MEKIITEINKQDPAVSRLSIPSGEKRRGRRKNTKLKRVMVRDGINVESAHGLKIAR